MPHYFSIKGKRDTFQESGVSDVEVIVSNEHSEGRYTIMEAWWNEDFSVPPHVHKTHSETFYVLEGRVKWTVNGETRILGAGDALFVPPNTVHTGEVLDNKRLRNMLIYEPGGYENYADNKVNYTPEELEDPEIKDSIRRKEDFHVAE